MSSSVLLPVREDCTSSPLEIRNGHMSLLLSSLNGTVMAIVVSRNYKPNAVSLQKWLWLPEIISLLHHAIVRSQSWVTLWIGGTLILRLPGCLIPGHSLTQPACLQTLSLPDSLALQRSPDVSELSMTLEYRHQFNVPLRYLCLFLISPNGL